MPTDDFDTEDTLYLTCPYCGNETAKDYDLIEAVDEDQINETECVDCGKTFEYKWTRGDITFSSYKK